MPFNRISGNPDPNFNYQNGSIKFNYFINSFMTLSLFYTIFFSWDHKFRQKEISEGCDRAEKLIAIKKIAQS